MVHLKFTFRTMLCNKILPVLNSSNYELIKVMWCKNKLVAMSSVSFIFNIVTFNRRKATANICVLQILFFLNPHCGKCQHILRPLFLHVLHFEIKKRGQMWLLNTDDCLIQVIQISKCLFGISTCDCSIQVGCLTEVTVNTSLTVCILL